MRRAGEMSCRYSGGCRYVGLYTLGILGGNAVYHREGRSREGKWMGWWMGGIRVTGIGR